MKIAIKDTNVLIDLESMEVLDQWFRLGYQTLTSSLIIEELDAGKHGEILAFVKSGRISAIVTELPEILPLYYELMVTGISPADASVLHLAIKHDAILLTGDGTLREQAGVQAVECHGTIWILDQLVIHQCIKGADAADRLERLIGREGPRKRFLPRKTAEIYIKRWRAL